MKLTCQESPMAVLPNCRPAHQQPGYNTPGGSSHRQLMPWLPFLCLHNTAILRSLKLPVRIYGHHCSNQVSVELIIILFNSCSYLSCLKLTINLFNLSQYVLNSALHCYGFCMFACAGVTKFINHFVFVKRLFIY